MCGHAPDECPETELTIRVQGGEAPVFADKQLMEELIYNLCDNAIRYNKNGRNCDGDDRH